MKEKMLKIVAIILIIILILSFVLTLIGKMTWRLFWFIAILDAVLAYYVIPWLGNLKD